MLKALELAWAAGMIDADGSIVIVKSQGPRNRTPAYTPRVAVEIREEKVCLRLQKIFGCGHIRRHNKRNPNHSNTYIWTACSRDAESVVKQFYPYLFVKQERAKLICDFYQLPQVKSRKLGVPIELIVLREIIYDKICALNKKGVSNKGITEVESC